jgi:hypothetical protein
VYKNHQLYITCDLKEAREFCWSHEFDVMFLDHDIGEHNLENIEKENTGYGFTKWLILDGHQKKAAYFIHSMNPTGANAMLNLLKDNGYEAQWTPFHLLKLEDR